MASLHLDCPDPMLPTRGKTKPPTTPLLNVPRELLLQIVEGLDKIAVKNLIEAYPHDLALPLLLILESIIKQKNGSQILILWAAKNGFADLVEILIDNGFDINERNSSGQAAIHISAWAGHQKVVKVLLEKGKHLGIKINQAKGFTSWTPLHLSARIGHIGIIDMLLTKGRAEVNTQTARHCRTPLHYAAHRGHAAAIKLLIDHGANIHARTIDTGEMALHFAAKSAQPAAVSVLLDNGSYTNSQSSDGITALHHAVNYDVKVVSAAFVNNSISVVRSLLEHGASIDILDNEGQTVLHYAVLGHVEVVEMLLEKGAVMHITNSAGFTAYELAMRTGSVEMKMLMHGERLGKRKRSNSAKRGG